MSRRVHHGPDTFEEKTLVERIPTKIDSIYGVDVDTLVRVDTTFEERSKTVNQEVYSFPSDYEDAWKNVVNPITVAAEKDGYKSFAITAYADPALIDDFRHATQSAYPFYGADDILLKTIVRSNPGLVLLKDGKIIQKWHYKKLPTYDEIKAEYIK